MALHFGKLEAEMHSLLQLLSISFQSANLMIGILLLQHCLQDDETYLGMSANCRESASFAFFVLGAKEQSGAKVSIK